MKKVQPYTALCFLLLVVFEHGLFAEELWERLIPRGLVNDYAGVLKRDQVSQLESSLRTLQEKTGAQIAVVILKSLEGGQIDDFSIRLAERWEIGQAEKDSGILFLIALAEKRMRIEVGYGWEGAIPDSVAKSIITNTVRPHFAADDFYSGVSAGIYALAQRIAEEKGIPFSSLSLTAPSSPPTVSSNPFSSRLVKLVIPFIMAFFLALIGSWRRMQYYKNRRTFYWGGYRIWNGRWRLWWQ